MNQENAQNAVNSAALVVAGIYFYRKLIEPGAGSGASSQLPGTEGKQFTSRRIKGPPITGLAGATEQFFGVGEVAPTGRFIVGWGFTFLTLSIVVGFAPQLAGYFALLIALGSLLGNGTQVFEDLQEQLNRTALPPATVTATPTVNVSFAGAAGAAMPERPSKPQGKQPRQSTHPRTTIA